MNTTTQTPEVQTYDLTIDGKTVSVHVNTRFLDRPHLYANVFKRLLQEAMHAGLIDPKSFEVRTSGPHPIKSVEPKIET